MAMSAHEGRVFSVVEASAGGAEGVGRYLYEMASIGRLRYTNSDGAASDLLASDGFPSTVSGNGQGGRQLFITSGGKGYVVDLSTALAESQGRDLSTCLFTEVAMPGAASVGCMIDGYFFALDVNTSSFYQSNLLDGMTWSALNVAQRISASDPWRHMLAHQRELWLFGAATSDVWYNAGTFPFAFQPVPSGRLSYGIAAPWSAVSIGDAVVWVGSTEHGPGQVVMATGMQPRVVSHQAMDSALSGYSTLQDAVAFGMQWDGHLFYVVTFPSADATWVFDITTGEWCELGHWDDASGAFRAYRPMFHAMYQGRHVVGDRADWNAYALVPHATMDVDGGVVRRVRRTAALSAERAVGVHSRFDLHLESGMASLQPGGESAQLRPVVELRYSDDAGKTWTSAGVASSGAMGGYAVETAWTRLGASRERVYEVVMTDTSPWRLTNAYVQVRGGR
jgi:hypothetical protein